MLRIAQVKTYQRQGLRQQQRGIGNHSMPQIPELQGQHCQNTGKHTRTLVINPPAEPVSQHDAGPGHNGREEPGRKLRQAEHFKRHNQFHIKHDRLVIPILIVNPR